VQEKEKKMKYTYRDWCVAMRSHEPEDCIEKKRRNTVCCMYVYVAVCRGFVFVYEEKRRRRKKTTKNENTGQ